MSSENRIKLWLQIFGPEHEHTKRHLWLSHHFTAMLTAAYLVVIAGVPPPLTRYNQFSFQWRNFNFCTPFRFPEGNIWKRSQLISVHSVLRTLTSISPHSKEVQI